jgi:pyruvate kinase
LLNAKVGLVQQILQNLGNDIATLEDLPAPVVRTGQFMQESVEVTLASFAAVEALHAVA